MKLYGGTWIIPGLIVFLALATFPFWVNAMRPGRPQPFQTRPAPAGVTCVLPKEEMLERHMQLLIQWRDHVVRDGDWAPIRLANGQTMTMSLTDGCMRCHARQDVGPYKALATYCGDCHDYVGVSLDCWGCHVDPKLLEENR